MNKSPFSTLDWKTIFLVVSLVLIGLVNLYSATQGASHQNIWSLENMFGKQLFFAFLGFGFSFLILKIESRTFERFSSVLYIIALLLLAGLFVFGKEVAGARSWYPLGSFGFQPSEIAKFITALALAKYLSDIHTDIKNFKHQCMAFLIFVIPLLLILPQPDPGTAMVFLGFLIVLYREGLPYIYLLVGGAFVVLFLATLLFSATHVSLAIVLIGTIYFWMTRKKRISTFLRQFSVVALAVGFSFSVSFIFNKVFEQRHRDRFNIVLGKSIDVKGIGYNTNQSQIAIGAGGWFGKGFLEGTQTKGKFVPEQPTDYIFTTHAEEWGFLGSAIVIVLFFGLIIRIILLAEKQRHDFSRIYGYGVASILFVHVAINLGMIMGLVPTIGIPLPFFSYGGSSMLGFLLMMAIFLKLNAYRIQEW